MYTHNFYTQRQVFVVECLVPSEQELPSARSAKS
jgi:hypothetical protein